MWRPSFSFLKSIISSGSRFIAAEPITISGGNMLGSAILPSSPGVCIAGYSPPFGVPFACLISSSSASFAPRGS